MKTSLRGLRFGRSAFLMAAWAGRVWAAADADIEFTGLLGTGAASDTKFILTVKATGESRWVTIGKGFAGYIVSSYDAKDESLVLTKDGQSSRVKLKASKVKPGGVEPSPAVQQAILKNLRQLAAASDQFYLVNRRSSVTYDELVGPTKYVRNIEPQDGEDYRAIVFAQGKPLIVTTAGGFKMRYDP
jgi:hypothetical protein